MTSRVRQFLYDGPRARFLLGLSVVAMIAASAASVATAKESPEQRFDRGAKELLASDFDQSIVDFEFLADRGFAHPDVSYNRGLAYAKRARTKDEQTGDLGRAAAAFEESLLMRPADREVEGALDAVRAEIARRRSRRAKDDLVVRPSLDRVLVTLTTERNWAYCAMGSSLLLAIGLLLRKKKTGPIHVAGSVLAPIAALGMCAFTPLLLASRWLKEHRQPGVIVVSETSFVDEKGRAIPNQNPIPEGSRVEVESQTKGDTVFVRWGASEGQVPLRAVRVLKP